jgi:hypothetical protein
MASLITIEEAVHPVPPIDDFKPVAVSSEYVKEGDARRSIAISLVATHMGLLLISVVTPVAIYLMGQNAVDPSRLSAMKELPVPISAGITSVTGVIGLVLGYYFKSQERHSI